MPNTYNKMNVTMKGHLITLGITIVAGVIAGLLVEKFFRNADQKDTTPKTVAAQPPRQVTVVTEETEPKA